MKNNNILIIGMGNLGYRYLEASLKLDNIKSIYLFDKKKRVRSLLIKKFFNNKKIRVLESLNYFNKKKFIICIVSTYSRKRYLLIAMLEKKFNIKNYIIEKILEQNKNRIFSIYKVLNNKLRNVWVNYPLRTMSLFKKIRNKIKNKKVLIKIKSTNIEMITNIFHYIDIYSHLLGSKFKALSLNQKSKFEKSKRSGFLDIYNGECQATFENGSCLTMKCYKTNNWVQKNNLIPPAVSVCHYVKNNNKNLFYIDQILNKIKGKNFQYSGKYETQYLSHYMVDIINDIIKNKNCKLPRFIDIYLDHANIVETIKNFYNFKYKKNVKCLNAT
jgi:hypothetical protein